MANTSLLVYKVERPFKISMNFNNEVDEVKYFRGEVFTTKLINNNTKQLEENGFIKFKQKLVW